MSKRCIGIEYDGHLLRVAIATQEKGKTTLAATAKSPCTTREEIPAVLRNLLGGEIRFGDVVAAAVPAGEGFVRWLNFPFAEARKIEAALNFELSAQLPVAAEDCSTAWQKAVGGLGGNYRVAAAAVRTAVIRPLLEIFDNASVPLNILDLAPFAFVTGLGGQCAESILACVTREESTVSLISEGRLAAYRLLPGASGQREEEVALFILRESATLQRSAGSRDLPLYLIGSGASPILLDELGKQSCPAAIPAIDLEGHPVAAEFLPAVALALRAGVADQGREFNFRRGSLALKSEWTILKNRLIAAACLLGVSFLALAGSAWFNYSQRAGQAETLKKEMTRIYKETFPSSKVIVDVPLQMRSGILELKKKGQLIGTGQQSGPLASLKEISENITEDLSVDVREFSYEPKTVRLVGVTGSFDAVNRMTKSLGQSPLFEDVQIADAKMSLDGNQVDFRINLTLSPEGATR